MKVNPDEIARLAISTHASLPKSFKPQKRTNGTQEWTVLAAIILAIPRGHDTAGLPLKGSDGAIEYLEVDDHLDDDIEYRLVSLGTGVKCLPYNKYSKFGDVLHDEHAEVLARRGFVRFLIHEGSRLAQAIGGEKPVAYHQGSANSADHHNLESGTDVLELIDGKFKLKDGIQIYLYVSTLPCGDASILFTAAHQPLEMALLKSASKVTNGSSGIQSFARGRNGYASTGQLRTKPGRTDSFPSISMSCSDKITTWNLLGLQGALLSELFDPIYIDHIVIGGIGVEPPSVNGGLVGWEGDSESWMAAIREEAQRGLFRRLASLEGQTEIPYRLNQPEIHFTSLSFRYDKFCLPKDTQTASQITSILHIPGISPKPEMLLQGTDYRAKRSSEPLPIDRRSKVCKLELMSIYLKLGQTMKDLSLPKEREDSGSHEKGNGLPYRSLTYIGLKEVKGSQYKRTKVLLRGKTGPPAIVPGFERCGALSITQDNQNGVDTPPFAGWLISGTEFESFDAKGQWIP